MSQKKNNNKPTAKLRVCDCYEGGHVFPAALAGGGRVVFKATLIISGPDISISTPKNQSIYLSSRVKK